MQMIGHDHEFVQDVFFLRAIVCEHIHHQFGRLSVAEQRRALPGHSCDEEGSIEGHSREMIDARCCWVCDI